MDVIEDDSVVHGSSDSNVYTTDYADDGYDPPPSYEPSGSGVDHGMSIPSYEPSVTDKRLRSSSSSSGSSTINSFSNLSITDEPQPNLSRISRSDIDQYIRGEGYGQMRFNNTQILQVLRHFNVAITGANVRQIVCKCKNYVIIFTILLMLL